MIEATGSEGFFMKADVSNSLEVQALVAETISRYGQLNYAFNNAGIEGGFRPDREILRVHLGPGHRDKREGRLSLDEI
jgi:NAD(P)-dependent dehydrogenase (short-subunit alcohol dehydrogenase family)